jgi:glycolate oxidase iron-sulfur subunit
MQTRLSERLLATSAGREAEDILRRCVHCGFCNATCPTYGLSANELEGPRGRIYLVKGLLEGSAGSRLTQQHLDGCLGCRACETTCPSGVEYHRLIDIAREAPIARIARSPLDRVRRKVLSRLLASNGLMRAGAVVIRVARRLLPAALAGRLPAVGSADAWPGGEELRHAGVMLGCVQSSLAPNTNSAMARVLKRRGIGSRPMAGCCGALAFHLGEVDRARDQMRHNIDAWLPALQHSEGLLVAASGCAAHVRDYGQLFSADAHYAEPAAALASRVRDLSDFLSPMGDGVARGMPSVSLHLPCTLKHALKQDSRLTQLLQDSGWQLEPDAPASQCCGSAGAYSILNRENAGRLRDQRLAQLCATSPERIVTANIGCQMHLATGTGIAVQHWIDLWDELESRHESNADLRSP